ncbi:hypothetical protein E2C01_097001 [Portunus trituberculatus]|uniref:Uncharacterized protein n=1 Tax=Portunus trituberculatus TaxID=210409 RepID=A0A5B7K8T1_PORTR|nr:hypothetical protein [Portunus trituberculatus]
MPHYTSVHHNTTHQLHCVTWRNEEQHHTTPHHTNNTTQHSTAQHSTAQHSTTQHNTTHTVHN